MSGNTIGNIFRVTTFGESHGVGLGTVIDGCPAGLKIEKSRIQAELDKRKPGASADGKLSASVTSRKEADEVEIISGIFNDVSEGTPIALVIKNTSQKSKDYSNLEHTFRPGHADYTYFEKYGTRDYRGGGRSSGRETASRVAAGAVAKILLESYGVKITAYTLKAAGIKCEKIDFSEINENPLRAPDNAAAKQMNEKIEEFRKNGDSAGGIVECVVKGVPAGLGEPVFDKLDAELAKAMLSLGAIKGIEFGAGFEAADLTGSTNNDSMRKSSNSDEVTFKTNNAGGILGGMSNGNDIIFRIAVKPVPSIFKSQQTITLDSNGTTETDLVIEGRHDICLCPRMVPVVEAMTAIVLADMILRNRCAKL